MEIKKVLVIFKTHLDIGFTDFSAKVVAKYMHEFIPAAISLAKGFRREATDVRFVWTTGSWLISEYLRTHTGKEKMEMEEAIYAGDIRWHGLPFTTHTELMSGNLFRYGLSLSQQLDRKYGRLTIAGKMTDVPGHTRAIVPYLQEAGIELLHIGVNPASAVPEVPSLFRWDSGTGKPLTVMYQKDYGEFSQIGNTDTAVYFAHMGDNVGVQSRDNVIQVYEDIRKRLPRAEIVAGDLNDLAYAIRGIENTLPVVTSEIGDTWIHGIGTDPGKVSAFRALERLYDSMRDGVDKETLARGLLMIPEHTWGLDVKTHLRDHDHYDLASFHEARMQGSNYHKMEISWQEQRRYLSDAVNMLEQPWQQNGMTCISQTKRSETSVRGMTRASAGELLKLGSYQLRFGAHGEITYLAQGTQQIADSAHPLLKIVYEQFSGKDYADYFRKYNRLNVQWAIEDFTKPGMENVATEHIKLFPIRTDVHISPECIVVTYDFGRKDCGCPTRMEACISVEKEQLHIDLAWFGKTPNRIAEAIWVEFSPIGKHQKIRKLNEWIDPANVVPKGQHYLHGTDFGVRYDELEIQTLDAALVAPCEPSLLKFGDKPSNMGKTFFNLYNNIWGTNFPMWYGEDARFRFIITPTKGSQAAQRKNK